MPKPCGKLVNILRILRRKTSAGSSPERDPQDTQSLTQRVKQGFIHKVIPRFSQLLSPLDITPLPLAEHYLYPVSTAPISNYNQRKLKKGNT